jgi:N-acetylglucosamine-6-sulfatase
MLPPPVTLVLLAAILLLGPQLSGGGADVHWSSRSVGQQPRHPNIVVITTDDQTLSQFGPQAMPFTTGFFANRGSVFTNALATPPLCCPSRAGFLTGQYSHNHGVLTNSPGYRFLKGKNNILPVWLGRSGYRTALIGKYLNGYPVIWGDPAPGWDRWFGAGREATYTDFEVADGDRTRHFRGGVYSTDVYSREARRFVVDSSQVGRPFFLWLTYVAPHSAPGRGVCPGSRAQPEEPADYRAFSHTPLPGSPAYAERGLADKGRWIRRTALAGPIPKWYTERDWRCALSALPPVDRGVEGLVRTLDELGQLDRTVLVFTSDNGFYFGEHGIAHGKELPYDPALRVPLAIAVPPGIAHVPGSRPSALVSNVDLAPTLLDYAHARPCRKPQRCRTLDGRSLRPILAGRTPTWTRDRAIPIELSDDFDYRALRTTDALYMELEGDPRGALARPGIELYDLDQDPYELHNLWRENRAASRSSRRRLSGQLRRLMRCSGTKGPRACP